MAYSVQYGDENGESATISGYLLVQPFGFDQGALLLDPSDARLVVQLHLARSTAVEYPSPTSLLPLAGNFEIRDNIGNTPVTVTGFRTEAIYSSQSFDIATTTWLLAGARDAALAFDPPAHRPPPREDNANHHPWRGTFDAGDGHRLLLSYLDYSYTVAAGRRGVEQMFAAGPANADRGGTVFSFVTGAERRQPLAAASVVDPHRNTAMSFFGAAEQNLAQMDTARGVVFALNGCFKHTTPSSLRSHIQAITNPRASAIAHPLWQVDPFEQMAQTIADTQRRIGPEVQFEVVGNEVEGIALWGMHTLPDNTAPALL